jgi:hypothetical protein
MQQIEIATQELAEISPTLHSIANLRISINSQVQPANQITLEFTGNELTDTAGPAPFVEPFTEPYAETADNSATDEFNATEVTVEHSTATRTPASIQKAGMFSPGGLSMVVIQTGTALALFALVCLTVFPDATVDVFSNATAAQIYNCVPVAQRHRLFLHCLNPRTLTLTTMQLALQDHNRSCRHVDLLHVEDLDPGYSHVDYQLIVQRLIGFNPDLLCTFRNRFEDRTLGSKLNGSMRYLVEHPAAIHRVQMVPCERQGYKDKTVLDQDSTQLTWAETVLELFDDYITGKYNVPICVGLFLDPDFAEIAFNNLEATELAEGNSSTTEPGAVTSSEGKPSSTAARNKVPKRPLSEVSHASTDSDQEDNMELTASSVEQCASTPVTTGEPQCGVPRQRALHTDNLPQLQAICSTATANSSSSKRQRIANRQRYAVDIGAGSATFCIEFLEANPTGLALAIDVIEAEVFWSRIPTHLRSRLKYHRAELTDWLDKVLLEVILSMYYPDIVYSDVTDIHFSPECQTLSEAGNTGARDKYSPEWTHPHRVFNGTTFAPTSDKARADDRLRKDVILNCLRPWAEAHPHVCITIENPWHSLILCMEDVQELLASKSPSDHTEWRVARVDYCKLRDPAVDPPTSP